MKNLFILCLVAFLSSNLSQAQKFPKVKVDVSPMDAIMVRTDDKESFMRIIYSRPKKNGRAIFGKLVPYGKIWRTGANEATEITFYKNVNFEGKEVKAGTYTLFTIPGENEWTVILNSEINQWGTYNYDASKDVARVVTTPRKTAANVETFSIAAKSKKGTYDLLIGWDDTFIELSIQ